MSGETAVVLSHSGNAALNILGLPDGMSAECFFSGVSCPRSREIMRIIHDVEMVEQLGFGMNRILRYYDRNIFVQIAPENGQRCGIRRTVGR